MESAIPWIINFKRRIKMISIDPPLTILSELREHIIPLGDEELFLLEKSIVTEGCREPINSVGTIRGPARARRWS